MHEVTAALPSPLTLDDHHPMGMDHLLDEALGPGGLRIQPFRISLADAGVTLADVLAHPRVGRVHLLEVARQALLPREIDTLLAWPALDHVRSLAIHINELGAEGVLRLLRSPRLSQLQRLEMHCAEGRPASQQDAVRYLEALVHSTPLPNLRRLRFGAHGGGAEAGAVVGAFTSFPRLEAFEYGLTPGSGNAVIGSLVQNPRMAALRTLGLDATDVDGDGLRPLLASGKTHALRTLSLRCSELGDEGFEALARAREALPSLERLVISSGMRATSAPLPVLARAELPRLRWLEVDGAEFRSDGLRALAGAGFLPGLLGLSLRGDLLEMGSVAKLLRDPRLGGLRRLQLNGWKLDQDGLALFRTQPGVAEAVLEQRFGDSYEQSVS